MVFPAVAVALITSAVLYFNSPRFPFYQIKTLRLLKLDIWNLLWKQTITATVEAEVEMENSNFIWSQVHATAVDMYHRDWYGTLQVMGNLQDKHSHVHNYQRREASEEAGNEFIYFEVADNSEGNTENKKIKKNSLRVIESQTTDEPYYVTYSWEDTTSTDVSVDKLLQPVDTDRRKKRRGRKKRVKNPNPVKMPPRSTVVMQDSVISVDNLPPSVYFNIVWEVLSTSHSPFGQFHMYNTGVAHVKALVAGLENVAIPATVEVMCDNLIDTLTYPARVIDRTCTPVEVIPTWINLESSRAALGNKIIQRLDDYDSVLAPFDLILHVNTPQEINERVAIESVEQWHDF